MSDNFVQACWFSSDGAEELPWWYHGCGSVAAISEAPISHHDCGYTGPWRAMLVGGDPVPEPDLIKEFGPQFGSFLARERASERSDRHEPHVDGPREPSVQERADHELMTALGVERIEEVMPAIERLRTAQPDPLKLSLPEVPEGTVALVGVDGDRYRWIGDSSDRWEALDPRPGWRGQLGALLDREGTPVRVELAAPREPRTAAEIWARLGELDRRAILRAPGYGELAEALDREAGL